MGDAWPPATAGDPDRAPLSGVDLLRELASEEQQVLGITDGELAFALPTGARSLLPNPWLATLGDDVRETVLDASRRSLLAHGDMTVDGDGRFEPGPLLDAVLKLRSTAPIVLLAQQQTATEAQLAALYGHDSQTTVIEQTDRGGIHRFWSMTMGQAVERIAFWAAPTAPSQPATAGVTRMSASEWETTAASTLADATRVSSIVSMDGDHESQTRRLSVFERPGAVERLYPTTSGELELAPTDASDLRTAIASLLG